MPSSAPCAASLAAAGVWDFVVEEPYVLDFVDVTEEYYVLDIGNAGSDYKCR